MFDLVFIIYLFVIFCNLALSVASVIFRMFDHTDRPLPRKGDRKGESKFFEHLSRKERDSFTWQNPLCYELARSK